MRRSFSLLLLLISLAGAWLRFQSAGRIDSPAKLRAASRPDYYEAGLSLREWGVHGLRGQPSAFRGIAYPAFLSIVETYIPAARPRGPRCEAALGSLEIPLAGWLAMEALSPLAGLCSAAIVAFHPALIRSPQGEHIEGFYGLVLLLVAAVLMSWARRPTPARSWLLGFAVAVSLLCRSVLFLFPPALFLGLRRRLGTAAPARGSLWLILGLSYLFLLPWVGRNAYQFHRFIPFEDQAQVRNLYRASQGVVSHVDGGDGGLALSWGLSEDPAELRSSALRGIAAAPAGYLASCALRLLQALGLHWALVLLAVMGFIRCRAEAGARALALLCGYFFLIHAPMSFEPRYFDPLLPLLAVLAALPIAALAERFFPALAAAVPAPRPRTVLWPALAALASLYVLSVACLAREVALSWRPCALPESRLSLWHCAERQAPLSRQKLEKALALSLRASARGGQFEAKLEVELGLLDLRAGDSQRARINFAEAARCAPDLVHREALRLQSQGALKESFLLLDILAGHFLSDADLLTDRGIAQSLLQEPSAALKDFQQASRIDPRNPRPWLNWAVLLERQGRWRQALAKYSQAWECARALSLRDGRPSPYLDSIASSRARLLKQHPFMAE
ncbi:MAG: tetratricopeptide repeat protein [Elusimicrobia bacterium]|nr:tetratricopeptide repeat protein [Elusimicrobiota bacterium]